MKALLDIQGWRKITEVPDYADHRGYVRIAMWPPFDALFRPDEKVKITDTNITTVDLFYAGVINNFPFFKSRQ